MLPWKLSPWRSERAVPLTRLPSWTTSALLALVPIHLSLEVTVRLADTSERLNAGAAKCQFAGPWGHPFAGSWGQLRF